MAIELCKEYQMPAKMATNFVTDQENISTLIQWTKAHHGISMQHFCFRESSGSVIGYGFDIVEDENLTAYILKSDFSKKFNFS